MFIGVDIGNTHIVAGIYDRDKILTSWRFATDTQKTDDEYMALLGQLMEFDGVSATDIDEMAIGSVVPLLTRVWHQMGRRYFNIEPLIIDCRTNTGMPILVDFARSAVSATISGCSAPSSTRALP